MRRLRRLLALAILVAVQSATAGRGFAAPVLVANGFAGRADNALEERLFNDATDGRLDEFSPLGAALVAGGVSDRDTLRRYERKADSLVDELRESAMVVGSDLQRVEAIFNFMHRRVLRGGYDLAATDLRQTLDQGRFNCISATVLFNHLAGQFGFGCRGLEMPSHAMSRVVLTEGHIDVETTYAYWFHSPSDRPWQPTARNPATAREVSPIQLVAMVYYNRGVDLLAQKRFAEAAAANAKSLRLDPNNATARGNLLATINNWSIDLGDSQRFAEAVDLLRRGMAVDPKFEPFAQNYLHVHHQWVEYLCRQKDFDQALAILARAADEMPSQAYLLRAKNDVRQRQARAAAGAAASGPLLHAPFVNFPERVD
jgi:tetratricopeptide (TPR) repeat protein